MRIRDSVHDDRLPASYYAATCNDLKPFRRLEGNERTQVCIVGGGFSGVPTALELAEKGYSVALLEQNLIGWGASGRLGGQIVGGYGPHLADYAHYTTMYGNDNAKIIWGVGATGVDIVKARVEAYSIDCALQFGHFEAAQTQQALGLLKQRQATLKSLDYKPDIHSVEAQAQAGPKQCLGGLVNTGWGHCHPLNLVRGEARAAESLGAKVFEDARVTKITYGEQVVVDIGYGKVTADTLVLACGAYMGGLVPKLEELVLPVGRYCAATEPLDDEVITKILPEGMAGYILQMGQGDFQVTPDNRLLFRGAARYSGKHPRNLGKLMVSHMQNTFPTLKGVKLEHVWGGYSSFGLNMVPQVGKIAENAYFMQGHFAQGTAAAHVSAKVVADAINGNDSLYNIISSVKHKPFPGGRLLRQPIFAAKAFFTGN